MTGKAVQRTLLIVVLLAIAHSIKPFSLRNLTLHAVHSAPSFSFVLPGSMRSGVENANQLASAMGQGWHLFGTRNMTEVEADWPVENNNLVAKANVSEGTLEKCNDNQETLAKSSTGKSRSSEVKKMVAKHQSDSRNRKDVREAVEGLIASNLLKLNSELEPLQLPDSKNFGPLSIPLPVLNRFSQCESRELRDSINAAKALRTVKEIQAVQDEESRKKDGNTKIVKVAAQQRIAQGVKVMISNVAARRVLVNCSTNFQMQSGLQINFKCT